MVDRSIRKCKKCRKTFKRFYFKSKKKESRLCKECRKEFGNHLRKMFTGKTKIQKTPWPFREKYSHRLPKAHLANIIKGWTKKLIILSDARHVYHFAGTMMLHGYNSRGKSDIIKWKKIINFKVPDGRRKEYKNWWKK